jgi:SnoaL-like domain
VARGVSTSYDVLRLHRLDAMSTPSTEDERLLDRYVVAFNSGIRSGDWAEMLALCTEDAELEFVGIPVGPFRGRAAIAEAYRTQPPDDELVVLSRRGHDAVVYAWARERERPAGELHVETGGGRISRVRVLYETFS